MKLLTQLRRTAALAGSLFATSAVFAQGNTAQALLDLLVKKGLVTPQEAAQLQQEAANNAAAAAAPASPASAPATVPATAPMAPAPSTPLVGVDKSMGEPTQTTPAGQSPLYFKIGIANFTPVGFLDFTGVYRSTNNGGSIGTSFGGLSYPNTAAGQLSETRLSAQNSRLGLKVDSQVGDVKVLGYVEADFLGSAPTNLNVTSNGDPLRMRVYFADVRDGPWEVLAGQDWSLLTPNRKGISPMPGDIFYTQAVDTNYHVGLIWGRQPQLRVTYHFNDALAFAFSAENPDQYVGSALTLPAGFTTTEVDNGSNGTATPNEIPDLIGKLAYDDKIGDLPFHIEAAGLYSQYKINTFAVGGINSDSSATGAGGELNGNITVFPGLSLFANGFYSNGGGRYISTALGPDFIVLPQVNGGPFTISTVRSSASLFGAEWDVLPLTKLFAYYGEGSYDANYTQLASGAYVGFGYPGSSNSSNRRVEEYTIGAAQTLWKNPQYGDLKILGQLSALDRDPFSLPAGGPNSARMTMLYMDLRYDLP